MSKKRSVRFSIKYKMLIGFIAISVISSILVGLISYFIVSSYASNNMRENLITIAKLASDSIDGDVHSSLKAGDESTEAYKAMVNKLRKFKKNTGLAYLYTFVPYNDKKVKFVLDTDEEKPAAIMLIQ